MGIDMLQASLFEWELTCYKSCGSNGNQHITSLIVWMGIDMLQASLFEWESTCYKPLGIKASFKWELACYKPHGSNGNQSLIAQMGIGMLQALWFKWESKPHCSNENWHSASLIVVTITVCVAGHPGAVFQSAEFLYTELHPQTAAADWHLLPVQQGFFQGRWCTGLNGCIV